MRTLDTNTVTRKDKDDKVNNNNNNNNNIGSGSSKTKTESVYQVLIDRVAGRRSRQDNDGDYDEPTTENNNPSSEELGPSGTVKPSRPKTLDCCSKTGGRPQRRPRSACRSSRGEGGGGGGGGGRVMANMGVNSLWRSFRVNNGPENGPVGAEGKGQSLLPVCIF